MKIGKSLSAILKILHYVTIKFLCDDTVQPVYINLYFRHEKIFHEKIASEIENVSKVQTELQVCSKKFQSYAESYNMIIEDSLDKIHQIVI